jgi:predicted dehydrogenase
MESQWNFGIIGLGRIGMRHAKEIEAHSNAQWVDAFDLDYQKIPATFKKHPDINRFFDESTANIIHVCTPNASHFELAQQALLHNKHVVIEKPITLESQHARILQKIARSNQKHIFCVTYIRFM